MKGLIITLLVLSHSFAHAHNMSEKMKREKIADAVSEYGSEFGYYDLSIKSVPLKLDWELQKARLETGDKDIEEFNLNLNIEGKEHQITCDFISGEVGEGLATYFIHYKNCKLIEVETNLIQEIKLKQQVWQDFQYPEVDEYSY